MQNPTDDSKKLYPLRFRVSSRDLFWGHFDYFLSDDGAQDTVVRAGWLADNALSDVIATYLDRIVGENVYEYFGRQFPVMVKRKTTFGRQPLTIGIGDLDAIDYYDSLGKKALWYIRKAEPGAYFNLGFSRPMDAGQMWDRCENGTIGEVLNVVHPEAGQLYLVNPGTVYSCGPGLDIIEIAEDSEMTNELYNWGEDLPEGEYLLLDQSLTFIDYNALEPKPVEGDVLVSGQEFHVNRVNLKAPLHVSTGSQDTFNIYFCVSGELSLQYPEEEGKLKEVVLPEGDSVLVPAEIDDYYLVPLKDGTVLFEVFMEKIVDEDEPYPAGEEDDAREDPHERTWNM